MKTSVEERFIWFDGEIVNVNDAKINVLSPASQFGLSVFEGIRCYWNNEKEQLFAFRLDDHFKRLKLSQRLIEIDEKYTYDELKKAFTDVITANDYREDICVRQTIFVEGFGSWASSGDVGMFVSPIPKTRTSAEYNKEGLNCCISSWERINDNALSPRIKCGANYINSRMAQREALRNGYDTAVFLNKYGKVTEGPGSCLFIVRGGKLITPLLTDGILESITRDTVITIAKDMGIAVEERTVDRTELYIADEAFLCGSAMEITPVLSVDRYNVGTGKKGGITSKIYDEYLQAVKGNSDKYRKWVTAIYE